MSKIETFLRVERTARQDMAHLEDTMPLGVHAITEDSLQGLLERAAQSDEASLNDLADRVERLEKWIKYRERRDDDEMTDEILEDEEQERSLARLKMRFDTMEHTLSHGHLLIHADNPDSLHNRVDSLEMEVHNLWANRVDRLEGIKLRIKKLEDAIETEEDE